MKSIIRSNWYVQLIAGVLTLVLMTCPQQVCGEDLNPAQKELIQAGKDILDAEAQKVKNKPHVEEDQAALDKLDKALRNNEDVKNNPEAIKKQKDQAQKAEDDAKQVINDRFEGADEVGNKTRKEKIKKYGDALEKLRKAEEDWKKAMRKVKKGPRGKWYDRFFRNTKHPGLKGNSLSRIKLLVSQASGDKGRGNPLGHGDTVAITESSTAVALAVLPEGTRVVTAPLVAGSMVKFNEPATAFVINATATATVVSEESETSSRDDEFVTTRVQPGDEIPADRLVAILLDTGLGIIHSHVSHMPELAVHVGRDVVVHDATDAATATHDSVSDLVAEDSSKTSDFNERIADVAQNGTTPEISITGGTIIASFLSDLPYSKTAIGTSKSARLSAKSHIEILIKGKKHGEVATFNGVNVKELQKDQVRFWTLNERGQYRREGRFTGKVVDSSIKVRSDKLVYRIGDAGVLLIWNQPSFLESQKKNRIGDFTDSSQWKLQIDASPNLAGIPKEATFNTHRLPFTVVENGQMRVTVSAIPRQSSKSIRLSSAVGEKQRP